MKKPTKKELEIAVESFKRLQAQDKVIQDKKAKNREIIMAAVSLEKDGKIFTDSFSIILSEVNYERFDKEAALKKLGDKLTPFFSTQKQKRLIVN